MSQFETKDSGKRVDYPSGMRRDVQDGKPRYDLIPVMPLKRLAELYARGAVKYGDSNWQLASSEEELSRFKQSAVRHMYQWLGGETDEDHAIATVWNIFAYLVVEKKLRGLAVASTPLERLELLRRDKQAVAEQAESSDCEGTCATEIKTLRDDHDYKRCVAVWCAGLFPLAHCESCGLPRQEHAE